MNIGHPIRVAILDLYEGQVNEGMRGIRDILRKFGQAHQIDFICKEFNVRLRNELPGLQYDIYIASGGPGSPLASVDTVWEKKYFSWINNVLRWNADDNNLDKKFIFFICHSFQLACRFFEVATVTRRRSTAFGVFPVHMLPAGKSEEIFEGLEDPFYAVDSRNYQVVQPDHKRLAAIGGKILCIEKERPHVPLERAVMGMRFNDYMVGTQFHPEADARGMSMYLQREDKKAMVIANHGREKWESMIDGLNDPIKIVRTYNHILPNFLQSVTAFMMHV